MGTMYDVQLCTLYHCIVQVQVQCVGFCQKLIVEVHYLISLGFQEFFFSKIVKLQWETIWGYKENSKSQSLEQYYF